MAKVAAEKPLSEAIRERRATPHFESAPIHDEDLKKILQAGLEAPSGYNLQPWRFVVVRDPEQKKRLQEAAMRQPRVAEAGAILVACGDTEAWRRSDLEEMLQLGAEHGFDPSHADQARKAVHGLLGGHSGDAAGILQNINVWINRHVTIAATTVMWMAECLGYDTAPMEGFFEDKVKQVIGAPPEVRVVMLLAIGRRKGEDKKYGGRFPMSRTVFGERWGKPLFE